jgi:CPA1 family monovalent cation:H+ antiporter
VTQALPFKKFLELLGVVLRPVDLALDKAQASLIAARRGQADLEDLVTSGLISRKDHAERRAAYQREVIEAEEVLRRPGGAAARGHVVDASLLLGRKAAILDATRRGLVTHEVADEMIGELDRELLRIADAEEEHG